MLVVDASFLMAGFVEETHTEFARDLLARAEDEMAAPGLMFWEFSNILWKKLRRGEILDRHVDDALSYLDTLAVQAADPPLLFEMPDLVRATVRAELTAYDTAYLILALEREADLATTDKRLSDAAVASGLVVHSPFA